jgi:hypothetical protein
MMAGGLMGRLLYEGRQDATYLHKVPLVRWREDFRYTLSMHHLLPVRLAAETGVLLHFKYLSDLPAKAAVEAERKQYGHGGKRYTSLNELFERDAALSLRCDLSERFRDTGQLVGRGLMRSSPALDALAAATVPGAPLLPGWPAPIPTMIEVEVGPMRITALIPVRDDRARLWRSLAAVAAQGHPPDRVLVVDLASADGTRDWLRTRWPAVEHLLLARPDLSAGELLDAALARIDADLVAFLAPGDAWPADALARLAKAATTGEPGLLLPCERLTSAATTAARRARSRSRSWGRRRAAAIIPLLPGRAAARVVPGRGHPGRRGAGPPRGATRVAAGRGARYPGRGTGRRHRDGGHAGRLGRPAARRGRRRLGRRVTGHPRRPGRRRPPGRAPEPARPRRGAGRPRPPGRGLHARRP